MDSCRLILEDGSVVEGVGFGFKKTVFGEVVFNTGMTGYQESLTDPSYKGQILIMSFPLIGNYGVNAHDFESERVQVSGFIVREICKEPSPMYGGKTLDEFLKEFEVPGIYGLDTRALIIKIREHGTLRGAISYEEDVESVLEKVRRMPFPAAYNLVGEASVKRIIRHEKKNAKTIALFDCGCKGGILRELKKRFTVIQIPYDTPVEFFRNNDIDGVVISNGPGDPAHPALRETIIKTIQKIKEDYPIMGICLGNQILALAFGGRTYKMKFGHRGANQPVKFRNKVFITSQNHGYAVDKDSLVNEGFQADQINVNDGTVEGMRHRELPIFSVQYHPEASPGPMDTSFLFDEFASMLEEMR
ncbi:MAG: glutamine-hydrolyzing carbamoyl-phosphate synthase small subunit [Methanomassiliicoccales archaeon]|nr:glutamine-hydrolyzing carbamoyl-phosphate synthase small subunit [Methanomassiliicoccales archaeon]